MSEKIGHYHMSGSKLPIGTILHGSGRPKVAVGVEDELELRRPKHKISRYKAVFSAPTMQFHRLGLECGYIHSVLMPEPRQFHDTYWIGKLEAAEIKRRHGLNQSRYLVWRPAVLDRLCAAYWSGEQSPEPVWECLSWDAEVVALISEECVQAKDTAGGWKPKRDQV